MDKTTHQIRCEQWTKIINECLSSGMTKSAWCKENGISDKTFYYWQRILRNESFIEKQLPAVVNNSDSSISFVKLDTTTISDLDSQNKFQPDVILRRGEVVFEISNSASQELLTFIGGTLNV